MDGGVGQKEKIEEIKREVRSAAARRRGSLPLDGPATIILGTESFSPGRTFSHTRSSMEPMSRDILQEPWNGSNDSSVIASNGEPGQPELDRRFIMFYFDHFFPFLYPFYKPLLLEGGRSWIMELVVSNEAMWNTTLCLSTYFVSVALDGAIFGPNVCKTLAWEKLLKQMSITFISLQHDLQDVASSNLQDSIVRTSRIMGSIVQLQRFETSTGNFENCEMHLAAASSLFRQIFEAAGSVSGRGAPPTIYSILSDMGPPLWTTRSQHSRAWSSDQAAFRFYSALLIVDDIIASTCTGHAPRLQKYHALVTNDESHNDNPPLDLEDFLGVSNWVMLNIGEIAALDAWKKSMKEAGQLDMMELVARASAIKQALLGNLAHLDTAVNTPRTSGLNLFTSYHDSLPPMPGGCAAFVTRVWAHAALLYLSVVVSGWQPGSVANRESVIRTLALLEQMPTPELLRTMVWPFCMAGCLADSTEEGRFRALADALVPHRMFGAARKALEIMVNIWKCRADLTIDTDFAACIRSSGSVSLLV